MKKHLQTTPDGQTEQSPRQVDKWTSCGERTYLVIVICKDSTHPVAANRSILSNRLTVEPE